LAKSADSTCAQEPGRPNTTAPSVGPFGRECMHARDKHRHTSTETHRHRHTQAQRHTGTDTHRHRHTQAQTHRHVHLVCALDTWNFWMSGSGATQRQRATYTHMRALDGAGHGRWQHTRTDTHTICAPGSEGYSPRTLFTRNLVPHASGVYSGTCRGPPSLGGRLKRHQPNTHTHTVRHTPRDTDTDTPTQRGHALALAQLNHTKRHNPSKANGTRWREGDDNRCHARRSLKATVVETMVMVVDDDDDDDDDDGEDKDDLQQSATTHTHTHTLSHTQTYRHTHLYANMMTTETRES
jgi:hypothetical protein